MCVYLPEVKYLLEGLEEVSIKRGVDDGVEQRVGIAEPEEQTGHPPGDDVGLEEGPN